MNEQELEDEVFKYYDTPFINKCKDLLREISVTLKNFGFVDKYFEYKEDKITKEELENYFYDTLIKLDEYRRHDLNELSKMLSSSNCGWYEYKIGEIIHNQLIKIWFLDEFKDSNMKQMLDK
jgi:hypothetical protein